MYPNFLVNLEIYFLGCMHKQNYWWETIYVGIVWVHHETHKMPFWHQKSLNFANYWLQKNQPLTLGTSDTVEKRNIHILFYTFAILKPVSWYLYWIKIHSSWLEHLDLYLRMLYSNTGYWESVFSCKSILLVNTFIW